MEFAALIRQIRQKLDDTLPDALGDYLVPTDTIIMEVSYRQEEFARQTLCLHKVVDIAVDGVDGNPPGTGLILRPSRYLKARSAYFDGRPLKLTVVNNMPSLLRGDFGNFSRDWRSAEGHPAQLVTDYDSSGLRLSPKPLHSGTLALDYWYMPPVLEGEFDDLGLPEEWHTLLIAGALSGLFDMQDIEMYDANEAQRWKQRWELDMDRARATIERNERGAVLGTGIAANPMWRTN
jgi:hypothetical protein